MYGLLLFILVNLNKIPLKNKNYFEKLFQSLFLKVILFSDENNLNFFLNKQSESLNRKILIQKCFPLLLNSQFGHLEIFQQSIFM
jgi:hypothetical protein